MNIRKFGSKKEGRAGKGKVKGEGEEWERLTKERRERWKKDEGTGGKEGRSRKEKGKKG